MKLTLPKTFLSVLALACALPFLAPVRALAETTEKIVNIYSARHYDSDHALYNAFTQATGIRVNLVEAKAEGLLERLKAEGSTSPADVLITVDAGNLWRAEHEGLFQPINSKILTDTIPAALRHHDGLWFGLSQRSRVFIVAKDSKLPAPSRYQDLADPKWRGRLCMRSSSNVYNQSLTGAMIAHYGPEAARSWAKGIVDNLARPPQGGDVDQIKAVATGECDLAVANTYYLARLVNSTEAKEQKIAEKVWLVFPEQGANDPGSHVNISGAGVLKNAPHLAEAKALIEFLVGDQAQNLFAQAAFEYPVKKSVPLHPVLSGFGTFKADSLNVSEFGKNNAKALIIADEVGWK